MKKILLFMAAWCLSSLTFAQTQVATLQHGESIRVFYHTNAFVDAYNAASSGDAISLSSGNFTACNINKDSLTIRGAGMDQTFFTESFELGSRTSTMHSITMEGVHCRNVVAQMCSFEAHFTNVYFTEYRSSSNAIALSSQFVNCILTSYTPEGGANPTLINCIINNVYDKNAISTYVNCIVRFPQAYYSAHFEGNKSLPNTTFFQHANFINSILICSGATTSYSRHCTLPSTASAQNCIGIKENSSMSGNNFFANCVSQNSSMVDSSAFSNFNLDALHPDRYILTDSAQAIYLGIDGTQVGLFGGYVPYSPNLKYPVITRMNVSNQTTADGRLSVDIQVGYTQEEDDDDNE